jgi:hypothetical protein
MVKVRERLAAVMLVACTVPGGLQAAQNPETVTVLRGRADSLVRQRSFVAAAGLYRQILERDSNQIDVFMGLGRATSGAGQGDEAIRSYRRALDVGVAPQNLIAYLLAQLYARRGDRDSTIAWLNRSLAFRLERRSQIAQDSIFSRWRDDSAFRRLAGLGPGEFANRVAGWRYDIDYLVAEAQRMHAGPERPAYQPAFLAAAVDLKRRITTLSDGRMAVEIQRLLAMLHDGHSILYPMPSPRVAFTRVPLDLWLFSDGLAVVGADTELAARVGQRIVAVGGVPVAVALRRLEPYVSRDNPMGIAVLGTFFLTLPEFVAAVGLGGDGGAITYTFETRDGRHEIATLRATGFRAPSFKLGPAPGIAGSPPLSLQHLDAPQWLQLLPEKAAVFVQYNQVQDGESLTVAQFADSLTRVLQRSSARHLIVDLRRNNGGNNGLNRPLVRALVAFDVVPGHHLWVLTGRTTFSAAQNFLNNVERWTNATFVGEPSGSKPNFAGEDTELLLPYSGLRGSISTRWWQDASPLDRRQWIAPQVSVAVRSTDYFANRDPVLEAVLSLLD